MTLIGLFGFKCGRDIDKLDGVGTQIGTTGVPIVIDHAIAFIEAEVVGELDCGTHTIFLGQVVECDVLAAAEPMTYAYYHAVKGGAPKSAPTYQVPEPPKPADFAAAKAARYVCSVCGYIYDPEKGDPKANVGPGTLFEDLPENWVCPVCGAGKDQFTKEG
jgi:rubredoxin